MINKNHLIIIGLSILFIFLFVIFSLLTKKESINNTNIKPTLATTPTPTLSAENLKNIKIQQQADLEFGRWQQEVKSEYPWYDKLPLQTDKYFVYFDLEQKIFIAQIYRKEELALIKTEIFQKLKDLAVEVEKYQFKWEVK